MKRTAGVGSSQRPMGTTVVIGVGSTVEEYTLRVSGDSGPIESGCGKRLT